MLSRAPGPSSVPPLVPQCRAGDRIRGPCGCFDQPHLLFGNQGHEPAEFPQPGSDFSLLLVDELQLLVLIASHRNDHAPALGELVYEFLRQLGSGGRDQDRLVWRRLWETSASVAYHDSHVSIAELCQQGTG